MKKKLIILLCAIFVMGTFAFDQGAPINAKWIRGTFKLVMSFDAGVSILDNQELRFYDDGNNYVGFEAPALSANQIWVLPNADGNALDVLRTDGSGTLSWAVAAGGAADAFTVKVDAAATAGYFGVAIGDGIFRVTENQFTIADGGDFVTLSLADHDTARAALGLEIGVDVPVVAHTMASHSDEDTYDISTSGSATATKGFVHGAVTAATPSGSFTIDWTAKQVHQVTITGANLDITFTNPSAPCRLWLVIIQGDGDDTVDWTNEADILFPGGVDPVLSTGSGDIDLVTFIWDGTRYLGVANYDFD